MVCSMVCTFSIYLPAPFRKSTTPLHDLCDYTSVQRDYYFICLGVIVTEWMIFIIYVYKKANIMLAS